MALNNVLVATGVTYYHQNDEAAFFEWLDRIGCVDNYRGEDRSLFITLRRRPTKNDLCELLALFFRYSIEITQLVRFETKSNRHWLRDPQTYWHHRMYGEGALLRPEQDRLAVWHDGSAICVIAVGCHGDPLDLGQHEAEDLIEKLKIALAHDRD